MPAEAITAPTPAPSHAIEARDLTKIYRLYKHPGDRLVEAIHPFRKKLHTEFAALDGLSFDIKKGEAVAFIGKNGSGKSTLLKIVTGIVTPTGGTVNVQGKISALLELGTGFNPELTGLENVYFTGAIMGIPRAAMEKRIDEILAFADIGDYVNQPVKRYSSGMFVRLAFAVAVHVEPEILIIDEALSVGDMRFQQKCYRRIREFKDRGITILFVTHDMGAVINFCDRALWLKDGKVEGDGPPVDVVRAYSAYMNYDASIVEPPKLAEGRPAAEEGSAWLDVSGFASFGDGGAAITRVKFSREGEEHGVDVLRGDQSVRFSMEVRFDSDIHDPLYGLLIKDQIGNQILSINTFVYEFRTRPRKRGDLVVFHFDFYLPLLRNGQYTISTAIAEGTLDAHVEHHWVHDAIVFQIANDDLRHRLGCTIVVDAKLSEES